jgi:hypothetical protein
LSLLNLPLKKIIFNVFFFAEFPGVHLNHDGLPGFVQPHVAGDNESGAQDRQLLRVAAAQQHDGGQHQFADGAGRFFANFSPGAE